MCDTSPSSSLPREATIHARYQGNDPGCKMASARLQVLVVENQPIMAAGIAELLHALGHDVVATVPTGEEAIEVAAKSRPDFVLMDVSLDGDMDGIEAAQEIRNAFGTRSIFFTGTCDGFTRWRASLVGPLAFLDKTSTASQLALAIETVPSLTKTIWSTEAGPLPDTHDPALQITTSWRRH
jgi:DNA-binding NarL/FixJ family response regulator